MGIGRVLGAAAPIAAGYFAPGSQFLTSTFGATAAPIVAGAAAGAGIAALSGGNVLEGGFTGGLGGMSGGSLKSAFAPGVAPTTTTAASNLENLRAANLAQAGQASNIGMMSTPGALGKMPGATVSGLQGSIGPNMGMVNKPFTGPGTGMTAAQGTSGLETGGGYQYTTAEKYGMPEGSTTFMGGVRNLGDGSTALGAGKLGLMGLGVAGSAGAFDPDISEYGDDPMSKYDPKRRLNLGAIDTGLKLNRDTGLRLLAEGGTVRDRSYYGIEPQYNTVGYGRPGLGGQIEPVSYTPSGPFGMSGLQPIKTRVPVKGIIDVGGKFKATPDGDITDIEYEDRFKYVTEGTTAEKNQEGSGDMDSINKAASAGKPSAGAVAALAQGFARQQTQGPTESQTLGLEALQAGGYLETGGEVGDGMSDEIEATIEGTQEARLSDGEFVIPADVVSHLGNGSSDAGARRLYEMMDKVRMARTGTKKQGKEINPERFMPA